MRWPWRTETRSAAHRRLWKAESSTVDLRAVLAISDREEDGGDWYAFLVGGARVSLGEDLDDPVKRVLFEELWAKARDM